MTLTLTQILKDHEQWALFGRALSEVPMRGDLGLGLDPEGPVQFARIHAFSIGNGARVLLAPPLVLTVYGPGRVEGTDQATYPSERRWVTRQGDQTIRLDFQRGAIESLLPK